MSTERRRRQARRATAPAPVRPTPQADAVPAGCTKATGIILLALALVAALLGVIWLAQQVL